MTQLAITGGNPVRDKPFPAWPVWDDTELEALSEVVRSGGWSIFRGTKVRALETQFAAYQGAKATDRNRSKSSTTASRGCAPSFSTTRPISAIATRN